MNRIRSIAIGFFLSIASVATATDQILIRPGRITDPSPNPATIGDQVHAGFNLTLNAPLSVQDELTRHGGDQSFTLALTDQGPPEAAQGNPVSVTLKGQTFKNDGSVGDFQVTFNRAGSTVTIASTKATALLSSVSVMATWPAVGHKRIKLTGSITIQGTTYSDDGGGSLGLYILQAKIDGIDAGTGTAVPQDKKNNPGAMIALDTVTPTAKVIVRSAGVADYQRKVTWSGATDKILVDGAAPSNGNISGDAETTYSVTAKSTFQSSDSVTVKVEVIPTSGIQSAVGTDTIKLAMVRMKLMIDGVSEADKNTKGGLVVKTFTAGAYDTAAPPRKKITIQSVEPSTWTGDVLLTVSGKVSVYTALTGGTALTFNGTDNKFASSALPKDLYVQGEDASDSSRDVEIKAAISGSDAGADTVKFTVLWVSVTGNLSGELAQDNAGRTDYLSRAHVATLGTLLEFDDRWGIGAEFVGTCSPSDFQPTDFGAYIQLERDSDSASFDGNGQHVYYPLAGGSTGFNGKIPDGNDCVANFAPLALRDDDPQSGNSSGVIYDWDDAGCTAYVAAVGDIGRIRMNGREFAAIKLAGGTKVRCAETYPWCIALSMKKTAGGRFAWTQENGVAGDNFCRSGTIANLTWNMAP